VVTNPTQSSITGLSKQQIVALIPKAITNLPARQRKVLIWHYYEERSFEEIAQLLDVSTSTARCLFRHGLNNLKRHILPADAETDLGSV
jgi:RNA polymerase sigma factor (sigma-70 family)